MATKKKTLTKRPPRSLWLVLMGGKVKATANTKREANALRVLHRSETDQPWGYGTEVVGPYVLAERVGQR